MLTCNSTKKHLKLTTYVVENYERICVRRQAICYWIRFYVKMWHCFEHQYSTWFVAIEYIPITWLASLRQCGACTPARLHSVCDVLGPVLDIRQNCSADVFCDYFSFIMDKNPLLFYKFILVEEQVTETRSHVVNELWQLSRASAGRLWLIKYNRHESTYENWYMCM